MLVYFFEKLSCCTCRSLVFYCVGKYVYVCVCVCVCVHARRGILLDGSEDAAKVLIKKFCTPVGFRKGLGDELQGEGLAGLLPYIRMGTVSPLWILGVLMLCGKIVPQVCSCAICGSWSGLESMNGGEDVNQHDTRGVSFCLNCRSRGVYFSCMELVSDALVLQYFKSQKNVPKTK